MNKEQIEEAIKKIMVFGEKVIELRESSFGKSFFDNVGVHISVIPGTPSVVNRLGPSDDSIRAWAGTIRMLISPRDVICFEKMHLLYAQLPLDPVSLKVLESHKQDVEAFLKSPANDDINIQIEPLKINGQEPTVEVFLKIFIYGDFIHLNEDKRDDFVNWKNDPLVYAFAQDRYCGLCVHVMNLALELVDLNDQIVRMLKKQL